LARGAIVLALLVSAAGPAPMKGHAAGRTEREAKHEANPEEEALGMTRAVACLSIDGYERLSPSPARR
jgi:hypothetical protein